MGSEDSIYVHVDVQLNYDECLPGRLDKYLKEYCSDMHLISLEINGRRSLPRHPFKPYTDIIQESLSISLGLRPRIGYHNVYEVLRLFVRL